MNITRYYPVLWILLPAVVFTVSFLLFDKPAIIATSCVLGLAMSAIVVTDARAYIIPDIISLPMIIIGIAATTYFASDMPKNTALLYSSLSAIFGFACLFLVGFAYQKYRQVDGLGMGDMKLAAVAGAWTGLTGLNAILLLSCLSAIATILVLRMTGREIHAKTAIPFGVFLAPAIWFVWLFQNTDTNLSLTLLPA